MGQLVGSHHNASNIKVFHIADSVPRAQTGCNNLGAWGRGGTPHQ
jgi:hypothetical protein